MSLPWDGGGKEEAEEKRWEGFGDLAHPQPAVRARLPPPWGLSFFHFGKLENGLTHRVINSIPMLKDSPRKPELAQVTTSYQK